MSIKFATMDKIIGELPKYDKWVELSASESKRPNDLVLITFYLTILPAKRLIVLSGDVLV